MYTFWKHVLTLNTTNVDKAHYKNPRFVSPTLLVLYKHYTVVYENCKTTHFETICILRF